MNEQFTPGQWKIYYPRLNKRIAVILDNKADCYVATIAEKNSMPVKANAHLIAAAPDMYEALKALIEAREFKNNITDIAGWDRQTKMEKYIGMKLSAWDKAKAALSKAIPK